MNEYVNYASVAILFLTLVAIIVYTFETVKLRKINNKLYKLEKYKLDPNVIAYFDYNPKGFELYFGIKNIGGGEARDIIIDFKPELNFGDKKIENNILFNKEQRNISVLLPGQDYCAFIGFSKTASELYKLKEIPDEYEIEIKYTNEDGKEIIITKKLTNHHLFWRALENDYIKMELKNIADNIKNLK